MKRVIKIRHFRIATINGQRIHRQIIAADRKEIRFQRNRIRGQRGTWRFDHGAQQRQFFRELVTTPPQPPRDAIKNIARLLHFLGDGHHRQQKPHLAIRQFRRHAQNRRELHFQQFRPPQQ